MKNFCTLPWYNREINLVTGKETVCCWLQNDVPRKELQQKFLSGESPHECSKCWQSEARGAESRRQMENRFLDFKMDRDIDLIESDAIQGISDINMYQLFLGSICNGTCVTCGPVASSSWRSLLKTNISVKQENLSADQNFKNYANSINWKTAKQFNFLGGEPFLIDRSFDILQKLLQVGNTDCRISFVTNGSVMLSDQQVDLIRKFSDISCCVSIDGVGKSFEYIRYPLTWKKLLENLEQYRTIFSEVVVSFTISNLNYHEKEDIIRWFQDQNLLYIENYVVSPPWFKHTVDPLHILWPRFVQEIANQDKIKGISIKDYLPHVSDLIEKTSLQNDGRAINNLDI